MFLFHKAETENRENFSFFFPFDRGDLKNISSSLRPEEDPSRPCDVRWGRNRFFPHKTERRMFAAGRLFPFFPPCPREESHLPASIVRTNSHSTVRSEHKIISFPPYFPSFPLSPSKPDARMFFTEANQASRGIAEPSVQVC